jgi:hypothetical protein
MVELNADTYRYNASGAGDQTTQHKHYYKEFHIIFTVHFV